MCVSEPALQRQLSAVVSLKSALQQSLGSATQYAQNVELVCGHTRLCDAAVQLMI